MNSDRDSALIPISSRINSIWNNFINDTFLNKYYSHRFKCHFNLSIIASEM